MDLLACTATDQGVGIVHTRSSRCIDNNIFTIPLKVTEKDFFERTKNLMVNSCMTEEDIVDSYLPRVNSYGICVPYYIFRLNYTVKLDYTAVYIETKHYTEDVKRIDPNGNPFFVSEIRIEHERENYPMSTEVHSSQEATYIAAYQDQYTDAVNENISFLSFIEHYKIPREQIQYYNPGMQGFKEIPFSVKPDDLKNIFDKKVRKNILKGIELQGHKQENIVIRDIKPDKFECIRVYVPFRMHRYDYNNKKYFMLMNCCDGRSCNNGKPMDPVQEAKHIMSFAGIYIGIFGLLTCLMILYSFIAGTIGSTDWIEILTAGLVSYAPIAFLLPLVIAGIHVSHQKSLVRGSKEEKVNELFKKRGII
ncbi:hypothetical protein [Methanolobus profundi]|uniref:Uncharacterized protein n=1 Tax=Methanolobus profundi TaxID=487685 RepID=A0A1I4NMM9_9EURY|nr:hypothetical protein [Methanolobus profundi]SFM16413.1 hypothetical protein SAMN04488696_0135 [Methanolobus profundi]